MDNYKILIVDDNKNNLSTLRAVLEQIENIDIIEAENGVDTLIKAASSSINLIILDIQLPDMNGYEIAKILKSRKKTMNIPIIFATAIFTTEEFIKKGFEIGAIDYLFKPLNEEQLLNKVKYYFSLYKKQMQLTEELVSTNRRLEQSEKMWRFLGENTLDSIYILDKMGNVIFSNRILPTLNDGTKGYEVIEKLIPFSKRSTFKMLLKTVIESKQPKELEFSVDQENEINYFSCKIVFINSNFENQIMVEISNITSLKSSQLKLQYMLHHDSLTGLYNRDYLDTIIRNSNIKKMLPLSIVMADTNGLKKVNENYGNEAGDYAIKKSSSLIASFFRENDLIARYDGDEFLILLPRTGKNQTREILHNIRTYMNNINDISVLKFAFGVATVTEINEDLNDKINQAENRMYLSKLCDSDSNISSVIETLKTSLLEKDYETSEHMQRMETMSKKMAIKMGLPDEVMDDLSLIASLHDIGKIGIPENILSKKGKLTEEEWKAIKKHPEIGYRILQTMPQLNTIASMVRSHHEWWDGYGYPQSLKKEQIPILSRIITILDSYDVMTNKRPYKDPMTTAEAIYELKRCSGTQFDPELVDIFISIIEE